MNAHKLIEKIRKNNTLESKTAIQLINDSIKFEIDLREFPNSSDNSYFRPPYPVTFYNLINAKGVSIQVLIVEKNDHEMLITPFLKEFDVNPYVIFICSALRSKSGEWAAKISSTNAKVCFPDLYDKKTLEKFTRSIACMAFAPNEILTYKNIKQVKKTPSKFINFNRKSKGKCPFYEYKTLTIDKNKTININELNNNASTHNSPRQHNRRGHVRHLSSGANVWIESCVVGKIENGLIEKEYLIK